MGIEKIHKISVSMVTNMLSWQPKKEEFLEGVLRTKKRSHSSNIPNIESVAPCEGQLPI